MLSFFLYFSVANVHNFGALTSDDDDDNGSAAGLRRLVFSVFILLSALVSCHRGTTPPFPTRQRSLFPPLAPASSSRLQLPPPVSKDARLALPAFRSHLPPTSPVHPRFGQRPTAGRAAPLAPIHPFCLRLRICPRSPFLKVTTTTTMTSTTMTTAKTTTATTAVATTMTTTTMKITTKQ